MCVKIEISFCGGQKRLRVIPPLFFFAIPSGKDSSPRLGFDTNSLGTHTLTILLGFF